MFGRSSFSSVPKMSQVCSGCGCVCSVCTANSSLDLQRDVEQVKALLSTEKSHVTQLERELAECRDKAESEINRLKEEHIKLRDRYDRLLDSHRKMQKVNNNLEDKFLTVVEQFEREKQELLSNVSTMTDKLSYASSRVQDLEKECMRYQDDCSLAVSLLQCKPSEFVEHRLTALPLNLQYRVREHLTPEQQRDLDFPPLRSSSAHVAMEMDDIMSGQPQSIPRVPMPTFPPIAVFDPVPTRSVPAEREPGLVPMSAIAQALSVPSGSSMRRSYSATSFVRQRTEKTDGSTQTDATTIGSPSAGSYSEVAGSGLVNTDSSGTPSGIGLMKAGYIGSSLSGGLMPAGSCNILSGSGLVKPGSFDKPPATSGAVTTGDSGRLVVSGSSIIENTGKITKAGIVTDTENTSTALSISKSPPNKTLSPGRIKSHERITPVRTKSIQRTSISSAAGDRWMDDVVDVDDDEEKSCSNESWSSFEACNKAAVVTVHRPLHSATNNATRSTLPP